MTDINLNPLRERWLVECEESDLGLWWLADDIREALGDDAQEEEVRRLTIEAIRPLLEATRLQVASLLGQGQFEPWEGSIEQQLACIENKWKASGKPDIGDIAWFIRPSTAKEKPEKPESD